MSEAFSWTWREQLAGPEPIRQEGQTVVLVCRSRDHARALCASLISKAVGVDATEEQGVESRRRTSEPPSSTGGRTEYSPDEQRVAKYIVDLTGIGGGEDPIGFLIASHAALSSDTGGRTETIDVAEWDEVMRNLALDAAKRIREQRGNPVNFVLFCQDADLVARSLLSSDTEGRTALTELVDKALSTARMAGRFSTSEQYQNDAGEAEHELRTALLSFDTGGRTETMEAALRIIAQRDVRDEIPVMMLLNDAKTVARAFLSSDTGERTAEAPRLPCPICGSTDRYHRRAKDIDRGGSPRIKSKEPSSWPPSAKPGKNSP